MLGGRGKGSFLSSGGDGGFAARHPVNNLHLHLLPHPAHLLLLLLQKPFVERAITVSAARHRPPQQRPSKDPACRASKELLAAGHERGGSHWGREGGAETE